jgi:hypothetical protein
MSAELDQLLVDAFWERDRLYRERQRAYWNAVLEKETEDEWPEYVSWET